VDPVTTAVSVAALAALAAGWRCRCRAIRAEAEAGRLRGQLRAERHAASHDPLTGLPNRRAFYQLGAALVADPTRRPLVGFVLDLDDFKQVNDTLGHAAGDQVLIVLARRLTRCAGDHLVARLGGDEFAGLLTGASLDHGWAYQVADNLARELAAPIQVAGHLVSVTASIGLAPVDVPAHLAEVLSRADAAMYRAKTAAHGGACVAPLCGSDQTLAPRVAPAVPARQPYRGHVDHRGVLLGAHPPARSGTPRRFAETALRYPTTTEPGG
jgi:diguanylate cyclase (GGDEF)-like protein